ncbi:MAG: ParB/RepB/Spo0J family partition protein [Kiritimatiellae bacterium]|nr:ParB/RepB/Spo0J family partition protein [Kiritimatiellia bacterium]
MAKKDNPFLKKATGAQKAPARVEKRHGLGRGLDGLLSATKAPVPAAQIPVPAPAPVPKTESGDVMLDVAIADIARSPYQPRREFKEADLAELAESLRNSGLVHPPTVRRLEKGGYELISGERRLRAAQLAGWRRIQVVVKDVDEETAAVQTVTENIQRADLNPIEEAVSYRTLQEKFNLTQADVAERVGKGRATVANAVRLLELPDEVKALVQNGILSAGHAKALLALEGEKDRILMARECVNGQLTVRALEKKVSRANAPAPRRESGTPDLSDSYVRSLTDQLRKHLGCAVRLSSGVTHAGGRHTKGVLEIDFFNNDDLDRIIRMIGLRVE